MDKLEAKKNFEFVQESLFKIERNFKPITISKEDSKILENVDELCVTYKYNEENGELVAQKLCVTYNNHNEVTFLLKYFFKCFLLCKLILQFFRLKI